MLWLCARFPQLPLEVLAAGGERPAAAIEGRRVLQANTAAGAAGVRGGQSLNTARSLCPALQSLPRATAREQWRLQQLALWAYRFTPELCLDPPDALLLEVSGSLRLFRGFARLYRGLARGLQRRSAEVALGLGPTPLAARLISHADISPPALIDEGGRLDRPAADRLLAALPLTLLACDIRAREKLQAMGLQSVGEVLGLPRAALNRRFGAGFGNMLDRLTGERPDPRQRFVPPDYFYSEKAFNDGLTDREQLRFPLSALLRELEQYLHIKQWINRHLQWTFHYSDGSREPLHMELSHRYYRHRSVLELVLLKLERIALQGPVERLALYCERFEALAHDSDDLFDTPGLSAGEQRNRFVAVLDRLQTRLGGDCCFVPAARDEHLPEQAWTASPPQPAPGKASTAPDDLLRPLWLMEPPRRLHEKAGRLHWRGELELLQGPERIDSQWWHRRQARDYYIARHRDGGLYWLYRDCLSRQWYVHGVFG